MVQRTAEINQTDRIWKSLQEADTVFIGAGAGLSTAAGFYYTGERFRQYFSDFAGKYRFSDMYSGGFYPFGSFEEYWAYWSRYIYINRYMDAPKPVYEKLFQLVKDKDYFVLTTNVDHCFQKAGFDRHRLFYTQGDYGLIQCSVPCHNKTYDNQTLIRSMVLSQGFALADDGTLFLPEGVTPKMEIPKELVPLCPVCGKPMRMNLREDDTFVEDEGWHMASRRYGDFVRRHRNVPIVYLELGVGMNTPVIVKYNFWQQVERNPKATYLCINMGEAFAPPGIQKRSICYDGDIAQLLLDF